MEEDKTTDDNLSVVDRTDRMLKEITEQNKMFKESLAKQEELYSKLMLGGRSGVQTESVPVVESPQSYADRIMKGGLNKNDK